MCVHAHMSCVSVCTLARMNTQELWLWTPPGYKSGSVPVLYWARGLASLCFSFLICEIRIMVAPASYVTVKIQ